MSNQKVTELNAATAPTAADELYLVQPANTPLSRRITLASLFGAIPSKIVCKAGFNLGTTTESLSSAATADAVKTTHVSCSNTGWTLTIPTGSEGDIKVVIMDSTGGGTVTLSGTFWNTSIELENAGAAVTMLFSSGKWGVIGQSGTATVT